METFTSQQIQALQEMVDEDRFSTGASHRELHRRDISPHEGKMPAGIIWPLTTQEVSQILTWCYANDVPVTPWGAGTSTEGNPVPAQGGLVVDLTRMDRILDIRPQDLQADVQPGVLRKELNRQTGQVGLFFPPDPGADASIGGMIANNASGVQTVATMIGSGLEAAALELLTPGLIELMNREKELNLPEVPSLFCEFHGISQAALQETADMARDLCQDCAATAFHYGVTEAERKDLWRARHEAWETIHRAHPGMETIIVDAAVPISGYPEMILFSQDLVDAHQVPGYVFGHAGDGNLHVVLAGDPEDTQVWSILESINQKIVRQAVELGGTCTGEHGVGIGKRQFMTLEHGAGYDLMLAIKTLVDPKGLMNPGKIFL